VRWRHTPPGRSQMHWRRHLGVSAGTQLAAGQEAVSRTSIVLLTTYCTPGRGMYRNINQISQHTGNAHEILTTPLLLL